MPERLLIIRHGETEANKTGIQSGWLDTPLTQEGIEHARAVGAMFKGTAISPVMYAAPSLRTTETANLFAAASGIVQPTIVTDPDLRERHWTDLEGVAKTTVTDLRNKLTDKQLFEQFRVETMDSVRKRVIASVKRIAENIATRERRDKEITIVVTSRAIFRVLLNGQIPQEEIDHFPNMAGLIVEADKEKTEPAVIIYPDKKGYVV